MKYIKLFELFDKRENAFLIRSKSDKNFAYDIYTDDTNKIYKVNIQGDIKKQIEDKLDVKTYLDFLVKLGLKQKLDYTFLKNILAKLPDLYVADVI